MINLTLPGFTLRAVDVGPRDAKPLILLHAFPLSHQMWKPQIEAFSNRYRVVAPDTRGLGASESSPFSATIDHLVDDLFAWMDFLTLGPSVVCGLSMGGYVLQHAMTREPERFSAVVLCDTRCEADDNTAKANRSQVIRSIAKDGVAGFAATFARKLLAPGAEEQTPKLLQELETMILAANPAVICSLQMTLAARPDCVATLPNWKGPAHVICGEHDQLSPSAVVKRIAELIPGALFHEIPGAGHLSNLENPAAFNAPLEAALQH